MGNSNSARISSVSLRFTPILFFTEILSARTNCRTQFAPMTERMHRANSSWSRSARDCGNIRNRSQTNCHTCRSVQTESKLSANHRNFYQSRPSASCCPDTWSDKKVTPACVNETSASQAKEHGNSACSRHSLVVAMETSSIQWPHLDRYSSHRK